MEGMTAEAWPAWRDFLVDYGHACRSRSLAERTLFCIPLGGELVAALPAEQLCLCVRRFSGYLAALDMQVFTASMASERAPLRRLLQAALAAELAQWDPLLAERLCQEPLPRALAVKDLLLEVAQERGWDRARCRAPTWQAGMVGQVDEVESLHAAALAVLGDPNSELERRVWIAEVRVLLPVVETRRRELLDLLPDRPELRRLEVGQLAGACINALPAGLRSYVRVLREIRNALSHLEPVTLALIDALERERPRGRRG